MENILIIGGGLARLAFPAKVITIIMSDIPGDILSKISGAPTVNESWTKEVDTILNKYNLYNDLSSSMRKILEESSSPAAKKMMNANGKFKFVDYHIIAGITDAIDDMAEAAFKLGYIPIKASSSCVGAVHMMSQEYVKFASLMILAVEEKISKLEFYNAMINSTILPLTAEKVKDIFPSKEKWGLGLCLLLGGQPLVNVSDSHGQGGPNQELALYFSMHWYLRCKQYPILNKYVVWFLGGSSSGKDGNTQEAGAYGYGGLISGIIKNFQELNDRYEKVRLETKNLMKLNSESIQTKEMSKLMEDLENKRSKVGAMLPDKVLRENNSNFLFLNINNGEELLELGDGSGNTSTNVGNLHVIRIVRFQCNYDGSCFHENLENHQLQTCTDEIGPTNER